MATTIQRAYEVKACHDILEGVSAFAMYDYGTMEATVSIDYDGIAISRTLRAKEALEYEAVTKAAALVRKAASRRFGAANTPTDTRYGFDLMLEALAAEVAANVDAYLYL